MAAVMTKWLLCLFRQYFAVFKTVLSALVDIWSNIELTFGGPVLIVVDQRNMQ